MTAIISDVHGNYPALKSVLKELDNIGCKQILSLGDVAGYYCMINECIDEFRKRGIVNLLGNHDSYLLGMGQCPRSTTVNLCIQYQRNAVTEENLKYLQDSPITYDNGKLSARHGGWHDPIDEYIYSFDFTLVASNNEQFYCSGHTHIQRIQEQGNKVYFNPGSVGQPRDGNPKAAYAIIDGNKVNLCRVEYPINDIICMMRSEGFEERISECLYYGSKIRTFSADV